MPDILLMTKVSLPLLRHVFVSREKILREISEGVQDGHLLTLVSAPAGYGKTTTVRMWAEETQRSVTWFSLEKSDNDFKQFLKYFLTALQQADDDLGQEALEALAAEDLDIQRAFGLLVNDIYGLVQPIILVLEDYHLIENKKIDQFVELILNHVLANLHLIITTREDPDLPLTRLRVRNQLTEIRAADLSFSLEEAGEFFSNVMGVTLSRNEMEILEQRTEGWAAGLQLAALSLKESADKAKFMEAFRGTHRHVLDYLIEEVLKSQPEDIKEFLRQTSILDQLSPSLCEAVTGQKASREYLQRLEHNNLFLISLDEERTWYRYHALFAELLKNQLLQTERERVDVLHERAADWYEKNNLIQKAVEHAFQIPDSQKVSDLIEKYTLPMIYHGEVLNVVGWFDRLPEFPTQYSPLMYICKAWSLALMHRQRRTEDVQQALRAAEEALNRTNADDALRNLIAGHIASIQAFLIQAPTSGVEEPQKLIEIAQKAQQLLPQDEKAIRSVNALNIGHGFAALADLPAAERAYNQAIEDGMAGGNFYVAIYGPINLILIAMLKGQLKNALQSCETNIDRFNQLLAGQNFPPIGALYILKGCILLEENLLSEAEQLLTQGLSLIRWTGEFRTHMKGYSALVRLRSLQGDRAGMLESIKNLEGIQPKDALFAQAIRHHFSEREWDEDQTSHEEVHLRAMQAISQFNALPDITGIDFISRIRFQTYLNEAHNLTRFVARNPQAYSLLDIHNYLARQEKFAHTHEIFDWLIEIWILRALMYHVAEREEEARRMIQAALSASLQRGYFCVFLDERDLMRPLLEAVGSRLKDKELSAFVKRLLEAMPGESAKAKMDAPSGETLSERELEVLKLLTAGESYKEIGQKLFLSLNTVQFHVKGIYRKLLVNKRVQAIEKAREMKLI